MTRPAPLYPADCLAAFRDAAARRHAGVVLGVCLAALLAMGLFCRWQAAQAARLVLQNEQIFVSALLEEKVPLATIATALQSNAITPAGAALVEKMGRSLPTGGVLLPGASLPELRGFSANTLVVGLAGAGLFAALLLAEMLRYFARREQVCAAACATVEQFTRGDYTHHLPRNREGTLYRLFAAIDGLAMALRAKSETEQRARENLKDTVSDISHQLKTPLAALSMYNEILAGAAAKPEVICHFTEKSAQSLARMQELIFSLLKVMRLDAGSISFVPVSVHAAALAARAAQELLDRAAAENKQLCFAGDPSLTVICDPQWTGEALGNLLKNALDHIPPGGHGCLYWMQSPAMVRFCVADDGEGIPPEELPFLFKRFHRGPRPADAQGFGLGLALAKAIVEGQQGLLSVESTPGKGSTFTISLPIPSPSFLTKPQAEIHPDVSRGQ
jgi:signal transduction histidine kinase